ncbi:oxidoreductase short chain dehydrogenase reductase family [Pyrenophora seminiperda CCB06]|uniref:Oxidoreductase short chain dehydrogenase reductase family n=1 Tax=Pyrenophora seminiperda CCB06 TaxID=1302712 RepID=A0A3M7M6E6_9PLEO|nr:oxidoreductase short chain dehydrogenase reductase family [Pyrenophora seminiperda CCB06]
MTNLSQSGKVVIVTGANRGLGRKAFAAAFAAANAKAIVLVARDISSLVEVEKDIGAINPKVQVMKTQADITDLAAVEKVYQKVKEKFGSAHVLVNNAGVLTSPKPISDTAIEDWWKCWEINVKGTIQMTQGFLKLLGSQDLGTVINLATTGSLGIYPAMSSYTVSKLAAVHLQSFVTAENPNVTAVSLDPCLAETDMLMDDFKSMNLIDFGLIGGSALWLTTEDAKFMNGRVFNVTWDADELMQRREEVVKDNLLRFGFHGRLGKDQFK